jgi:hypothetical protein
MIDITLRFASISAAINALKNVPEADLALGTARDAAPSPAPAPVVKAEKPATVKPTAAQPAAAPVASAAPAPTTAPAPAVAAKPAADAVDYPTLQKAVFKLAGISREEAGAAAKTFGVNTFKELPADKWGEALKAVNAKIEELSTAVA